MNEKKKLIFDKIANGYLILLGYEFLFILYVILYGSSGNIPLNIGIVLFVGGIIAIIITTWVFIALLYDIYKKL